MKKFLIALALTASPLVAAGSTLVGNPATGVVLAEGNDVYVHSIVGYRCGGGSQTIPIDVTLGELDSEPFEFDEDEFCEVVVRLEWTSTSSLESVAVTGYDTLDVDSTGSSFTIDLDQTNETATFN